MLVTVFCMGFAFVIASIKDGGEELDEENAMDIA